MSRLHRIIEDPLDYRAVIRSICTGKHTPIGRFED